MVSNTFPDTTFRVAYNNFKFDHAPPGGEAFDAIKARDSVKYVTEVEVLDNQGYREAVTSNIFSLFVLLDVVYAAGQPRLAMN